MLVLGLKRHYKRAEIATGLKKNGSKRIDEIEVGDLVMAKNVMTGETDYRKVKDVDVKRTASC